MGPVGCGTRKDCASTSSLAMMGRSPSDASLLIPGKLLVTASRDETLKVWHPTQGNALLTIGGETDAGLFHQAPVLSFDCSNDSSVIFSGAENGSLRLSSLTSGKILHKYEDHGDSVESVCLSPILPIGVSASLDGTMKLWDMNNGNQRSVVMAHQGGVIRTRIHSTEALIYTCGVDCTVKVWDMRTSECLRVFRGHNQPVLDLAVSK